MHVGEDITNMSNILPATTGNRFSKTLPSTDRGHLKLAMSVLWEKQSVQSTPDCWTMSHDRTERDLETSSAALLHTLTYLSSSPQHLSDRQVAQSCRAPMIMSARREALTRNKRPGPLTGIGSSGPSLTTSVNQALP